MTTDEATGAAPGPPEGRASTAEEAAGQVITFYSYKGGTGRSMALANVACLLAGGTAQAQGKAKGVVVLDWDLEAPGQHVYFRDRDDAPSRESREALPPDEQPGIIDLFLEIDRIAREEQAALRPTTSESAARAILARVDLGSYIRPTFVPGLHLMQAGKFDGQYATRVNAFHWEEFYKLSPRIFRVLAEELATRYSYVLVDSRTGETDISGICTTLMPDKLVTIFTPNRQSTQGVADLIRRATTYRRQSDDTRPLVIFPLVSRVDNSEQDLRALWRSGEPQGNFDGGYQPMMERLLREAYGLPSCDLGPYFDSVQIQHIPKYSFGEEIAVLSEEQKRQADRLSITASFRVFAGRLIQPSGPWEEPGVLEPFQVARPFVRPLPVATWSATGLLLVMALLIVLTLPRQLDLARHRAIGAGLAALAGLATTLLVFESGLQMKKLQSRAADNALKVGAGVATASAVFALWLSPISPLKVDEALMGEEAIRVAHQSSSDLALLNVKIDSLVRASDLLQEQVKLQSTQLGQVQDQVRIHSSQLSQSIGEAAEAHKQVKDLQTSTTALHRQFGNVDEYLKGVSKYIGVMVDEMRKKEGVGNPETSPKPEVKPPVEMTSPGQAPRPGMSGRPKPRPPRNNHALDPIYWAPGPDPGTEPEPMPPSKAPAPAPGPPAPPK